MTLTAQERENIYQTALRQLRAEKQSYVLRPALSSTTPPPVEIGGWVGAGEVRALGRCSGITDELNHWPLVSR